MESLKIQGSIDLQKYIDETDVSGVPTEKDVDEIMIKRLTKGELTLNVLDKTQAICKGDVVTFSVSGSIAKYNKEKLAVAVGNGLYSKTLEDSMTGHLTGDTYTVEVDGINAEVTIKEVKRKSVPQPTDAMAEAMGVPEVHTVGEYHEYLAEELVMDSVYPMVAEIMERIQAEHPVSQPSEETIKGLSELEVIGYREMIKEANGTDILTSSPEELMELIGIDSLEKFKKERREWYIQQAEQCTLCAELLGKELRGELDPMENFEAYSLLTGELSEMLFNRLMDKIKGGK